MQLGLEPQRVLVDVTVQHLRLVGLDPLLLAECYELCFRVHNRNSTALNRKKRECRVCHSTGKLSLHKLGPVRFAALYNLDVAKLIAELRGMYEAGT
jgi:hypothetical protein